MILRRIGESLRKQDWTSVTIEVLIVVLGVFIGLQVSDWGADQASKRRGHEYVQRLVRDLERDHATREQLVAYYDAVNEAGERANTLLAQSSPNPAALVVNAYRATEYAYSAASRATWDEIVSSGDISLLPRAAVDGGLADYFASDIPMGAMQAIRTSEYRRRVRSIIPHDVQKAIREGCSDLRNDADQSIVSFREECTLDVSAAEIAAAARALQRDPRVREDLRFQFSEITTARANIRGDVARIEGALSGLNPAR